MRLAVAVLAAALLWWATAPERPPAIPEGTCASSSNSAPRFGERITVAAVFARMPEDPDGWSRSSFERMLADRRDRRLAVDIIDVPGDPVAIADAINAALITHDVVYYNGHDHDGALDLAPPPSGRHLAVLDTCWSTQRLSARLFSPTVDVIGNTERAVKGSVSSFVALLDGLVDRRGYGDLLTAMNSLADRRAAGRRLAKYPTAERYRLDVACPTPWVERASRARRPPR